EAGVVSRMRYGAGFLAYHHGDSLAAARHLEASVALYRTLEEPVGLAYALVALGQVRRGTPEGARVAEESVRLLRAAGDRWGLAYALLSATTVTRDDHDIATHRHLLTESHALWQELGDRWGIGLALFELAGVSASEGDLETARGL